MSQPSLEFNSHLYHINDASNLLLQFQERGYVVLRGVFQRESVDAFREEVEARLVRNEHGRYLLPGDAPHMIWPVRAPRIRQMLPGALSPLAMKPAPAMFESAWLISEPGPPVSADKGWHKDRGHEAMPGKEYHFPDDVHLGIYFRDMKTPEDGPTEIIPRSHRDASLSPYSGAKVESFFCNKEDVVMWDQRCWHRGTTRSAEGLRYFAVYGFYGTPIYGPEQRTMPECQKQAWLEADDPLDRVYFGGTFTPKSVLGEDRSSTTE